MKKLILLSLLFSTLNAFSQRCYEMQPIKNTTTKKQFWKAVGVTILTVGSIDLINWKCPKYQKYNPLIYAGWAKITIKILKPKNSKKGKSKRRFKYN